MKLDRLAIPDVVVMQPSVHEDARGCFYESFNLARFEAALGRPLSFVQDNHSQSARHVLRGLHYQIRQAQGKLVRVVQGEVLDVAVDLRRHSATFGHWVAETLSAANRKQIWIPEGFAHGFLVLSDGAEILYKTTDYYSPEYERCIVWNDSRLNIAWPPGIQPVLSAKDAQGSAFLQAEVFDT